MALSDDLPSVDDNDEDDDDAVSLPEDKDFELDTEGKKRVLCRKIMLQINCGLNQGSRSVWMHIN